MGGCEERVVPVVSPRNFNSFKERKLRDKGGIGVSQNFPVDNSPQTTKAPWFYSGSHVYYYYFYVEGKEGWKNLWH